MYYFVMILTAMLIADTANKAICIKNRNTDAYKSIGILITDCIINSVFVGYGLFLLISESHK